MAAVVSSFFSEAPAASVGDVVALIEEDDPRIKAHAVRSLLGLVDVHWAEIADEITPIELLAEDESFPDHNLAALLAAKCFYHLEDLSSALRLALTAGPMFNVDEQSEFVNTMIAKCLDEFTAARIAAIERREEPAVDPRMQDVVDRMFERCFADGEYRQALGIALEARMLDKVREAVTRNAGATPALLTYTFVTIQNINTSTKFRTSILDLLAELYMDQEVPDVLNLCRCLQFLDRHEPVADRLVALVSSGKDRDLLLAFQVAFDLSDNENQDFLKRVKALLPSDGGEGEGAGGEDAPKEKASDEVDEEVIAAIKTVKGILDGTTSNALYLDFLSRANNCDRLILHRTLSAAASRNAILHHALVCAHNFMNAGTTSDVFLRSKIQWLGQAKLWNKFSITAGQGVIHKGHLKEAMTVLGPYLPGAPGAGSPYSQGGALMALGLIWAGKGLSESGRTINYLRNALRNTANEVVQHGACLGLGLSALATHDDATYVQLRELLMQDNAVLGEAAGLGIGLTLCGAGPSWASDIAGLPAITETLQYARDTKHEKIIRGISMGIALQCFGKEDEATVLIEEMINDKDDIIRYGGVYAVGLAFSGTADNTAIRKLLHIAVSDVSDDVRRAAVTNLGFLLYRTPEQVPRLVALLAESYNPHVRYGACMAMGVACAGTHSEEAVALLLPMADDKVDIVRQGALMALGMVLQQASVARSPVVKTVRDKLAAVVGDKHMPTMTKMGAIVGQGILDAGGRNCVISLRSGAGFRKMSAVVGMAVFLQYWYWFPLANFLSLAFTPTTVIGLNKDLKLPREFKVKCAARPSHFAYPEKLSAKKEEVKKELARVELSTSAKARKKAKAKEGEDGAGESKGEDKMEGVAAAGSGAAAGAGAGSGATADAEASKMEGVEGAPAEPKAPKEPTSFEVSNPGRVTAVQASYVRFLKGEAARYVPVREDPSGNVGVVMLLDTKPELPEDVVDIAAPHAADSEEPECPEEFDWTPPED